MKFVMAGLVPAIHDLSRGTKNVDARDIGERSDTVLQTAMPGHDEERRVIVQWKV
jgi:hypothetical protein